MSSASKCDKCRKLFEHEHGTICMHSVGVCGATGKTFTEWELELCLGCSKPVLDLLAPAMDGLELPMKDPWECSKCHKHNTPERVTCWSCSEPRT